MRNAYKLDLVTGQDNKVKTLWEILSEKEKKVIVMNIPMTYPPKPVNGILISGMDAPSTASNFTYPLEIREELLNAVPDYKIRVYLGGYLTNNQKRLKALDLLKSTIHARTKAVLHLMKNHPWDLFVVRYNNPDNVQHQYWNFMDETHPSHDVNAPNILKDGIKSIYRELDKAVGIIYSNINKENTTFIIMSDHGGAN